MKSDYQCPIVNTPGTGPSERAFENSSFQRTHREIIYTEQQQYLHVKSTIELSQAEPCGLVFPYSLRAIQDEGFADLSPLFCYLKKERFVFANNSK